MSYPETYVHEDHDGGRLTVDPAKKHNAGIWIEADCFVHSSDVPDLVDAIWARAQQSAHELGKLPCPHPGCGPCSFDRAADACPVHEFAPEHLGVSEAKRRLANCTGCGHNRFADCHPDQRATEEPPR